MIFLAFEIKIVSLERKKKDLLTTLKNSVKFSNSLKKERGRENPDSDISYHWGKELFFTLARVEATASHLRGNESRQLSQLKPCSISVMIKWKASKYTRIFDNWYLKGWHKRIKTGLVRWLLRALADLEDNWSSVPSPHIR